MEFRRIILVCMLMGLFKSLFAQKESEASRTMAVRLESWYNAGQYDSIFQHFSGEMKAALPLEETRSFFGGLMDQAGKIRSLEFKKYQASYAGYKAAFERGTFLLNLSLENASTINGLFIKPYTEEDLPTMTRNQTPMILPFRGEWTVFWGGDTKEQNYHVESEAQKGAFDLVITDKAGKTHTGSGTKNEDYYAFGKELLAPCDGQVVLVVDGIPDNKPGEMNPIYVPGNTVVIRTAKGEYLLFAHFRQHSIRVREGQEVLQGALLGLCGNSGNSSEPHLHFHLQNHPDMMKATGMKAFFGSIRVNGTLRTDYSPVKGERIQN